MSARSWKGTIAALAAGAAVAWMPVSAGAGKVKGKVELPAEGYGDPPPRSHGFVRRRANPYRPTKSFDPYPNIVVVLVGEQTVEAPEPARTEVPYVIPGETFASPLIAVRSGRPIRIRNTSFKQQRLFSPEDPTLIDKADVINAKVGVRSIVIKKGNEGKVFRIRSSTTPHLIGRVVTFRHPYFAQPNGSGRFEIKDVPKGTYKVRVWYKDGWLKLKNEPTVTVKRGTETVSGLRLPAGLDKPAPTPAKEPAKPAPEKKAPEGKKKDGK
jgi:hypothetical protein